jgi:site-specific DNA recombinase
VLVDDLSRLSRDNHFLLTLYADFRFNGVRILSRADSLDTDDHHAKLGFQMRGIVNELYLDDLRDKTLRGQKGQKSRGCIEGAGGSASAPEGAPAPGRGEAILPRSLCPSMRRPH